MTRRLFVAAGGSGDVIAATVLALRGSVDDVAVATLSWDRLIVDPLPGPRSVEDFSGLSKPAEHVQEVTAHTTTIPPAGSTLPRLTAELPGRMFLLDAAWGAHGIAGQISAIAEELGARELTVVDVGGDIVAHGGEAELRSPLADLLVLAGCLHSGLPTSVVVCGPALDGELDEKHVFARLADLSACELDPISPGEVRAVRPVLQWHRSEASGMLIAAAAGARGKVEVRDAGTMVALTERSAGVHLMEASRVAAGSLLFGPLTDAKTLDAAEEQLRRIRGFSEIDYERKKTARFSSADFTPPSRDQWPALLGRFTREAHSRGADYVTVRRMTELMCLRGAAAEDFLGLLQEQRADRYEPPLWRVSP